MKKLLVCAVGVALIAMAGSAYAQGRVWDDLSWWGKSGATPAPVKDPVRSGCWWWPTDPKSNANDSELWGNRGVVYNIECPGPAKEEEVPVTPPPAEPPAPARTKPVLGDVLFDFDKAVLKPEGKAETDKAVSDMKAHTGDTVLLEGHTDSIGSEAYNMALGQRRADAVRKYMVEQGIDEKRITTKSFGESQPVKPNDTPANRALNRRVVFQYNLGSQ